MMFRKLFAIETAALHYQDEEPFARQDQLADPSGENLHDLTRFIAIPSCYGMWSSRPVL